MAGKLDVSLHLETCSVAVSLPLSPVEKWWRSLSERNAASRMREMGLVPVQTTCPSCGAGPSHLTLSPEHVRVCRACSHTFDSV